MDVVPVAVGVIVNASGQVLISRRAPDVHQGGLWEFPGGKVEAGETVELSLARELSEELDIVVKHSSPLLRVSHDYGDKRVLLDVRMVWRFEGEARSAEGQPLRWVAPAALRGYAFPEANQPIIDAVLALLPVAPA